MSLVQRWQLQQQPEAPEPRWTSSEPPRAARWGRAKLLSMNWNGCLQSLRPLPGPCAGGFSMPHEALGHGRGPSCRNK